MEKMANTDTTMTLTGVYSGSKMEVAGSSGTISTATAATAQTGYRIATAETAEGKAYSIVSVVGEAGVTEPPSVVVAVTYSQKIQSAEIDLDVRYTNIPAGTSLQVACSETTFNISKQEISGSSLIGSSGKELGAFETSIDIRLWITRPDLIAKNSALTLSMSKIGGDNGGPVKKVLLEKIVVNLSN